MIASGTPREVAIELTEVSDKYYDSAVKASREAHAERIKRIGKVTPKSFAKEKIAQLGQAGKKLGSNVKVAALNARERMKDRAADRKAQAAADKAFSVAKPIEKVDSKDTITKDEDDATATSKAIGNIRKSAVQGINLGKRLITGRKGKKDSIDYLEIVKEYYGYNDDKALQALRILTKDQLDYIKKALSKGGKHER